MNVFISLLQYSRDHHVTGHLECETVCNERSCYNYICVMLEDGEMTISQVNDRSRHFRTANQEEQRFYFQINGTITPEQMSTAHDFVQSLLLPTGVVIDLSFEDETTFVIRR